MKIKTDQDYGILGRASGGTYSIGRGVKKLLLVWHLSWIGRVLIMLGWRAYVTLEIFDDPMFPETVKTGTLARITPPFCDPAPLFLWGTDGRVVLQWAVRLQEKLRHRLLICRHGNIAIAVEFSDEFRKYKFIPAKEYDDYPKLESEYVDIYC